MTLPLYPTSLAFSQIQGEFGGGGGISLSEYYAGAANNYVPAGTQGFIPLTTRQSVAINIPSSGPISVIKFFGARQKEAAGSQFFYASGTFTGKYGYTAITLEWYDNDGYHAVTYATTPGTSYDVTIGGAGAASSFGTQNTGAFDKSVFNVWSRVDAVSYPRTTIYNGLSAAYNFRVGTQTPVIGGFSTFNYNGSTYNNTMYSTDALPAGYDKNNNYYPAEPRHGSLSEYFSDQFGIYFTNDYEAYHGQLYHSAGITTFPSTVAYNGGVYLSYNSSYSGQGISIDTWDVLTGDLRMAFGESNPGERDMQGVVNYRQPVWIKASWG